MYHVASFYEFRELSPDELPVLQASWQSEAARLGLSGTVLLASEGVNASLAGERPALDAFVAWVRQDRRFAALQPKLSTGARAPFRRLEVKVKRWLIRFAEADDPTPAAVCAGARLPAAALQAELAQTGALLVDVRNDYETAYGRFAGAMTLPIGKFTEFPAAFLRAFADVPKDRPLVFYCTGGIRCEKVVPWATAHGYTATQLDGGILGYFAECSGSGFDGQCFVFDDRLLVDAALAEAATEPRTVRLPPPAARPAARLTV